MRDRPLAITFSDVKFKDEELGKSIQGKDFLGQVHDISDEDIKRVLESLDIKEDIKEKTIINKLAAEVYNDTYVPNEPDRIAERNFKAQPGKPQNINRTTFRK